MSSKNIFALLLCVVLAATLGYFFFSSKKSGLVVINVLDKELYHDCHIKNSINIPMEEIDRVTQEVSKDAEVVVYCSNYMCSASGFAQKYLQDLGFGKVWAYEAGMAEWKSRDLPVVGDCKERYLQMPNKQPADYKQEEHAISTDELAHKMGFEISQ